MPRPADVQTPTKVRIGDKSTRALRSGNPEVGQKLPKNQTTTVRRLKGSDMVFITWVWAAERHRRSPHHCPIARKFKPSNRRGHPPFTFKAPSALNPLKLAISRSGTRGNVDCDPHDRLLRLLTRRSAAEAFRPPRCVVSGHSGHLPNLFSVPASSTSLCRRRSNMAEGGAA